MSARFWDDYFAPGGGWEQNGGRRQTRVFADRFCKAVRLDSRAPFALLDFGCALGEALKVFHRRYPRAILTGMDVSRVAIRRCAAEIGSIARLEVGSVTDVEGQYDVIYASNVLEHFVDYRSAARQLLAHWRRLCMMVPFVQTDEGGLPLRPDPAKGDGAEAHHHTFHRESFEFLVQEGLASGIAFRTVACPGAWGWGQRERLRHCYRNFFRRLRGKPPRLGPLQAIYDIRGKGG